MNTENAPNQTLAPQSHSVERLYTLRDRDAVLGFLERHPEVTPVLVEAIGHIHDHFPNSSASLRVEYDTDISVWGEYLYVGIYSPIGAEEAAPHLQQFDMAWWLDQPLFLAGALLFLWNGEVMDGL